MFVGLMIAEEATKNLEENFTVSANFPRFLMELSPLGFESNLGAIKIDGF